MDNNMSEDTKYNGWTNYATWRIQLELIEDYVRTMAEDWDTSTEGQEKWDTYSELGDYLKEFAEEAITSFGEIPYELAKTADEDNDGKFVNKEPTE